MSFQITEAFVQQFSANIYMLAQQKGSRLRPFVRSEVIQGKSKAFDRIGTKTARRKTTRHEDTPQTDTPHSRRWCYLADYDDGDLIDDMDKIRILNDPTSEYMMAIAWALGRSMDDVILEAADGTAVTGEAADGTATLANTQKFAATDGTSNVNLNVRTLRAIKKIFDANDIPEEIPRHIALTSSQLYSLLGQTEVTSADYNAVKALVNGQVDTFLGFKFHRLERVNLQSGAVTVSATTGAVGSGSGDANGYRKVIAWAQDGLVLGIGKDITGRIAERSDKCFSVQTYGAMSLGSVRMEEKKVVVAFCNEA
jgi:hypothetical protein